MPDVEGILALLNAARGSGRMEVSVESLRTLTNLVLWGWSLALGGIAIVIVIVIRKFRERSPQGSRKAGSMDEEVPGLENGFVARNRRGRDGTGLSIPGQRADQGKLKQEILQERLERLAQSSDERGAVAASVIASIEDGIVLAGCDGGILMYNPRAALLFGLGPELFFRSGRPEESGRDKGSAGEDLADPLAPVLRSCVRVAETGKSERFVLQVGVPGDGGAASGTGVPGAGSVGTGAGTRGPGGKGVGSWAALGSAGGVGTGSAVSGGGVPGPGASGAGGAGTEAALGSAGGEVRGPGGAGTRGPGGGGAGTGGAGAPGPGRTDLDVRIVPVRHRYGTRRMVGALAIFKDVTESLKVERLRSEFVATVSHEFRTPLAIISGFLELFSLRENIRPEDRKRALAIVELETERLKRLVSELLTLSEMENALPMAGVTSFDASDVVRTMIVPLQEMAARKGLNMSLDLPERGPEITGNAGWYQLAVRNLVENAVAYTPAGGKIQVSLWCTENGRVEFEVRDTGIGIAHEDLPRIFERFYRVEKARSSAAGGSGLGLALVRDIAAMAGGGVSVESEPGVGSRFTLWVPAVQVLPGEQRIPEKGWAG